MAVTLEWVRDNYDATGDRFIDATETWQSMKDNKEGLITDEQRIAVQDAYHDHTLLPRYDSTTPTTTETIRFDVLVGSKLIVNNIEVI